MVEAGEGSWPASDVTVNARRCSRGDATTRMMMMMAAVVMGTVGPGQ